MMDLPKTWTRCTVADITTRPETIHAADSNDREISYIDIGSINNRSNLIAEPKRFLLSHAPSRARQVVKAGDILFATVRPYLRNIAQVPESLDNQIASTGFAVLRAASGVDPKYLFYKATSRPFVSTLSGEQYGVSYPAVRDEQVRAQPIELPPTNEQRRIVAKIEELFSELDKGIEALTTAREQLRAYRKSILKHAFEANSDDWPEYTIGQLVTDIRYGTAKKCAFDPSKTPVLRIPNIASGLIDLEDLKHTDFTVDELEKLRLEPGDILLVRSNGSVSLVGLSAVVTASAAGYAYAGYLIRLRLKQDIILPEFLNLYLHSPKVRIVIERQARSTSGVHNINSDEIRAISIRVPSIRSQKAIIDTIERLATQIDALESCTTTERQRGAALRQAILAKAFCGQIVAQDPEDEPASVLLERIGSERNGASALKNCDSRNGHARNSKNGKKQFA